MSFLSKGWKKIKKGVSTGWSSVKDEVKDFTGVDSMNTLAMFGPVAMGAAALGGQGMLGEALAGALSPLTAVPEDQWGPGGGPGTGPMYQGLPDSMTMGQGAGGATPAAPAPNLAGLFGESGYSYGSNDPISAQLLASNPAAYQYNPLFPQQQA